MDRASQGATHLTPTDGHKGPIAHMVVARLPTLDQGVEPHQGRCVSRQMNLTPECPCHHGHRHVVAQEHRMLKLELADPWELHEYVERNEEG